MSIRFLSIRALVLWHGPVNRNDPDGDAVFCSAARAGSAGSAIQYSGTETRDDYNHSSSGNRSESAGLSGSPVHRSRRIRSVEPLFVRT